MPTALEQLRHPQTNPVALRNARRICYRRLPRCAEWIGCPRFKGRQAATENHLASVTDDASSGSSNVEVAIPLPTFRYHGEHSLSLSEYMVLLDKPIGLTLAPDPVTGQIIVHSIKPDSPAALSHMIQVGDVVKMCSAVFGEDMWAANDIKRIRWAINNRTGKVKLLLERRARGGAGRKVPTWCTRGKVGLASWGRDTLQPPVTFNTLPNAHDDNDAPEMLCPGKPMFVGFHRGAAPAVAAGRGPTQAPPPSPSHEHHTVRAARLELLRQELISARSEAEVDLDGPLTRSNARSGGGSSSGSGSSHSQYQHHHQRSSGSQGWGSSILERLRESLGATASAGSSGSSSGSSSSSGRQGGCEGAPAGGSVRKAATALLPWLLVSHSRLDCDDLAQLASLRGLSTLLELQLVPLQALPGGDAAAGGGTAAEAEGGLAVKGSAEAKAAAAEAEALRRSKTSGSSGSSSSGSASSSGGSSNPLFGLFSRGRQQQQQASGASNSSSSVGDEGSKRGSSSSGAASSQQGNSTSSGGAQEGGSRESSVAGGSSSGDVGVSSGSSELQEGGRGQEGGAASSVEEAGSSGPPGSSSGSSGGYSESRVRCMVAAAAALQRLALRRLHAPTSPQHRNTPDHCGVLLHCVGEHGSSSSSRAAGAGCACSSGGVLGDLGAVLAGWLHWHCCMDQREAVLSVELALGCSVDQALLEAGTDYLLKAAGERGSKVLLTWRYGGLTAHVAGDVVGGWSNRAALLRCTDPGGCKGFTSTGHFYLEVTGLRPGTHYYKFIIDGTWAVDPTAPKVLDQLGNWNNVLHIEERQQLRLPPPDAAGSRQAALGVARREAALLALGTKLGLPDA